MTWVSSASDSSGKKFIFSSPSSINVDSHHPHGSLALMKALPPFLSTVQLEAHPGLQSAAVSLSDMFGVNAPSWIMDCVYKGQDRGG